MLIPLLELHPSEAEIVGTSVDISVYSVIKVQG